MMKNNWKKVKLGDLCHFQYGKSLPSQKRIAGEYPVYGSGGITGFHNDFFIKAPGIIIGRKGSIGTVYFSDKNFCPIDTVYYIEENKNIYDLKFLYYLLSNSGLDKLNSDAAVPGLNRNTAHQQKFLIPERIGDQKKIAEILSGYDDLIENNNRRIKILEEMAQAIYKQWFVDFKFPGYEKVKMVDSSAGEAGGELGSMPEGWEVVCVEDVIKRVQSGKKYDNKTAKPIGAIPILDQGRSGFIGYHDDEPGVMASKENPIIVFANHTCYQNLIMFPFSAIQNILPFLPNDKKFRNIYWLHWATKDLVSFNDYKGHWPEFISKRLFLPNKELCQKFGEIIEPMIVAKFELEKSNSILRKTRDLLLPKLMSEGMII